MRLGAVGVPAPQCEWGIPAKEDIKQQLAAGTTPDAIIAQYVSKYGEQVLAAPTKRGFNMVVWVLPFAMLLIGAVADLLCWPDRGRRGAPSG